MWYNSHIRNLSVKNRPGKEIDLLQAKIAKFNKALGREIARVPGSGYEIDRLSSGILDLDTALGGNSDTGWGFPRGKISEIFGPPFAGKTTICYLIIAGVQAQGKICALIDTERTLDPVYAKMLGVDLDMLLHVEPDTAEEAFDCALLLMEDPEISLYVFDSVYGMTSKKLFEEDFDKQEMGKMPQLLARFTNTALKKISKTGATLICVNQFRESLSMYDPGPRSPGGNGYHHALAVQVQLSKATEKHIDPETKAQCGNVIKGIIKKNRHNTPFLSFQFPILYDKGLDHEYNLVYNAMKLGVLEKAGAWYSMSDGTKHQGMPAWIRECRNSKDLFERLKSDVIDKIGKQVEQEDLEFLGSENE